MIQWEKEIETISNDYLEEVKKTTQRFSFVNFSHVAVASRN